MTGTDDTRLEALLARAAADAAWPETPDLRAAVVARIVVPATPDLRPSVAARIDGGPGSSRLGPAATGRRGLGRLVGSLAVAAALLLAVAGVAAGLGFRLPGLEIQRVETLPPAGAGLDLGSPITLDRALAFDRPRVRLPATLPPPQAAYELVDGGDPMITVAWRAEPGRPVLAGTDLALTLMAVPGDVEEALLTKLAGPGTTVEPVTVDGGRGWWIGGAPHEILVRRSDGSIYPLRAAIAGDTLLFVRDGTLYRLESSLGKEATLALAASMR